MTTALIVLPLAAALVVWLLPLPGRAAGALALLAALAEVVLFAVAFGQFDFEQGLQLRDQHSWFSDLGVSYDVGFYGFSLFLAGLTVVVCTVAIGYALWAGGDRGRAYHGLLLFLMGSIVGVFAAQDLLLFYVFFEAMLIPIYVLIGVWGGPRRLRATATFVIYTMAGSLLMLASIIAFGLSQGTFSLVDSGVSSNDWVFLGFLVAFAVKAPIFPFHGWLVDAYRESPPEVAAILSGVVSKAAVYGLLRIVIAKFPEPVDQFQTTILAFAADRPHLRLAARVPRPRHPRRDGVLVDGADGPDHDRPLLAQRARRRRRDPPVGRARARLGDAVPARGDGRDAHRHERLRRPRRDGARAAGARDRADDDRDHRARGARLGRLRGRVPDPRRRLRRRAGAGPSSAPPGSCSRRCTCCG